MSIERPRATRRGAKVDWVKFDAVLARDGSVNPVDKALYAAIASFVDITTRETPETYDVDPTSIPDDVPTRKRLAECIGRSVDTVDRSSKRLEEIRLLRVHRQPNPDNPKQMLPSEYELLDHHLWDERAAARKEARDARRNAAEMKNRRSEGGRTDAARGDANREGGGRTSAARGGRTDAAGGGRTSAAVKEEREVEEREEGEKPVVPAGGRSTGSSARDGSTPSAEQPASASSGKRELHPGIAAIAAAVPDLWKGIKPSQRGVASLSVRDFLKATGSTPDDVADLVARRWFEDEGKVQKPLAWLRARGLRIETEVPEHVREERRNQRTVAVVRAREEMPGATGDQVHHAAAAAVHGLIQQQKSHAMAVEPVATWRCVGDGCGRVGRGDMPDDGLCEECWGQTPEGACALLAARLDA